MPVASQGGSSSSTPLYIAHDLLTAANDSVSTRRLGSFIYFSSPAAKTATDTTTGTGDLDLRGYTELELFINVTAVSGTTPTLDLYMQDQLVDANNANIERFFALHIPQITAVGFYLVKIAPGLPDESAWSVVFATGNYNRMRSNQSFGSGGKVVWVIGGTTPSFTVGFGISGK